VGVVQDPASEAVDVVDEDDRILGTVPRSVMRTENLRHRATFIVVRSSCGEVLVHRRAEHKDVWPGRWDLAVGGVVRSGESWADATRRELAEEVGIEGDAVEIGRGRYRDDDVDLVARIHRIVDDGPFRFADGEVVEACFVSVDELGRRLHHERAVPEAWVPDSVALVWPLIATEEAG